MTAAKVVMLRSAVPQPPVAQAVILDALATMYGELPRVGELFASSVVSQRHFAWDPREMLAGDYPGIGARMRAFEHHAMAVGRKLLPPVLAGLDRDRIGSFVMASSTGYTNPGPESLLAKEFGLRTDLRRTFIGHMGCYAAFNAMKVGLDALAARPEQLALVCCIELSSLHLRSEPSLEQAVVHTLFGDAGSVALLSAAPDAEGITVLGTHTETHYAASDAMTLRMHDDTFRMTLSPFVPVLIAEKIEAFVDRLLAPAGLDRGDIRHWGIHPGGPKIIDLVGDRLGLAEAALDPSRQILAEYGNCASATILLILERIVDSAAPQPGEYGVLMAFGPGLTIEAMLVRF